MKPKAIISWSGGKDSALALHAVRNEFEIVALLTTVTEGFDRISIHGVRTSLLERQAQSLNCALHKVIIPKNSTNDEYEDRMRVALDGFRSDGVTHVICGDIFLKDVRRYREERLLKDLTGVFPLWQRDTTELAKQFICDGFQAILCCVDTNAIDASFAGRNFDEKFLSDLPDTADPCGENGEFHTFVHAGPIFSTPIECVTGERVLREERFEYCDLILCDTSSDEHTA
jgi:uncharacterized protein (TIGR00290 family)